MPKRTVSASRGTDKDSGVHLFEKSVIQVSYTGEMIRDLFTTMIVLIIVISVAGYYIQTRYRQAAELGHLTSIQQINGLAPSQCSYSIGSYGDGSAVALYAYNNQLRIDIPTLTTTGYNGPLEAIVAADGSITADTATQNAVSDQNAQLIDLINQTLANAPWNCLPWFIPSESDFQLGGTSVQE
jgi:hypothetical protein